MEGVDTSDFESGIGGILGIAAFGIGSGVVDAAGALTAIDPFAFS
jgi:hypothetical protein